VSLHELTALLAYFLLLLADTCRDCRSVCMWERQTKTIAAKHQYCRIWCRFARTWL